MYATVQGPVFDETQPSRSLIQCTVHMKADGIAGTTFNHAARFACLGVNRMWRAFLRGC